MIASRKVIAGCRTRRLRWPWRGAAQAQETKLTVMVFSGVQNMPIIVAQTKGFFTKRGLSVEVLKAPSSDALRNGLVEGKHQIVHGGVDNAVAMAEVAKADISILMGGDNGWNRFIVQADTRVDQGPARQDGDRRCADDVLRLPGLSGAQAPWLEQRRL